MLTASSVITDVLLGLRSRPPLILSDRKEPPLSSLSPLSTLALGSALPRLSKRRLPSILEQRCIGASHVLWCYYRDLVNLNPNMEI